MSRKKYFKVSPRQDKTLTVSLSSDLITRVRELATERQTTISALVRDLINTA